MYEKRISNCAERLTTALNIRKMKQSELCEKTKIPKSVIFSKLNKRGRVMMLDLYNRIEELCRSRGINITVMCQKSGAPRGALSDIKTGRKKGLSSATLEKIAEYFGVTVDYILGRENKKLNNSFSPEDAELLKRWEELKNSIPNMSPKMKQLIETLPELDDDEVEDLADYSAYKLSKKKGKK